MSIQCYQSRSGGSAKKQKRPQPLDAISNIQCSKSRRGGSAKKRKKMSPTIGYSFEHTML